MTDIVEIDSEGIERNDAGVEVRFDIEQGCFQYFEFYWPTENGEKAAEIYELITDLDR